MVTIGRGSLAEIPETFKFSRERFYRALDVGLFEEQDKVELIGGELITEGMLDRMLQKSAHAVGVVLASKSLAAMLPIGYHLRSQLPLSLGENHDVEPDIVVAAGTERDFTGGHPKTGALIVEVSETTLRFDQTFKASLYSAHGIADFWIVNLLERVVEIRRKPVYDPRVQFEYRYETLERKSPGEMLSPLLALTAEIPVDDLLP